MLDHYNIKTKLIYPKGSLFFAPMEGITDDIYREVIQTLYPDSWDYYACDFLRIPSNGVFKEKHIIEHYGKRSFEDQKLKEKTLFQILVAENSIIEEHVKLIQDLKFPRLDINLGCPSKVVNTHKGGAYLLKDLDLLQNLIRRIRKNFSSHLTCKMRLGFHNTENFKTILKLLEDEGIEAITIHGRTRDELYKGVAQWSYIGEAVQTVKIPIIGNGDIWTIDDVKRIFNETGCHGIMLGRCALKSPWLAMQLKLNQGVHETELRILIQSYFNQLSETFLKNNFEEELILKKMKSVARYIFDDLEHGAEMKTRFMRSTSLEHIKDSIF